MKRCIVGDCEHDVKVTRIKGVGYGIRVYLNGEINQECTVESRDQIGKAIYQMLRMEDKCGNISDMASRSRHRYNEKLNRLYADRKSHQ